MSIVKRATHDSRKLPQKIGAFSRVSPFLMARSPNSALLSLFWGEGSPTKIDNRKSWYRDSILSTEKPRWGSFEGPGAYVRSQIVWPDAPITAFLAARFAQFARFHPDGAGEAPRSGDWLRSAPIFDARAKGRSQKCVQLQCLQSTVNTRLFCMCIFVYLRQFKFVRAMMDGFTGGVKGKIQIPQGSPKTYPFDSQSLLECAQADTVASSYVRNVHYTLGCSKVILSPYFGLRKDLVPFVVASL